MRLATIQTPSGPRAAVLHGSQYIDLHATDHDLPDGVRALLEAGPAALKAAEQAALSARASTHPAATTKLLAPVPDQRKIVCLGLNYRDHAAESGSPIPKEPVLFSKFNTALVGHEASVVLPAVSQEVDYEAELVLVVGKAGRHLTPHGAMDYLAGYHVGH